MAVAGLVERLIQCFGQAATVGQAGQRVALGQLGQPRLADAQAGIGFGQLAGALNHPGFQQLLRLAQGADHGFFGLQGFTLGFFFFLARQVDAIRQGKRQQQHFQCRANLDGVGGQHIGR